MFAAAARRERDDRFWSAVIATSFGGGNPWELLGEQRPDAADGGVAWGGGGPSTEDVRRMRLEAGRRAENDWRVAVGLVPDDDLPPEVTP